MEKADWHLEEGKGRTKVYLTAWRAGDDLVVYLYNKNIHLGAVAVGEYDHEAGRAYSSVITLRGHRDDEVAKKQAHIIATHTRKSVCVIAGIHLDNITEEEIAEILRNCDAVVQNFTCKSQSIVSREEK